MPPRRRTSLKLADAEADGNDAAAEASSVASKRAKKTSSAAPRGRPSKSKAKDDQTAVVASTATSPQKKRGRPAKAKESNGKSTKSKSLTPSSSSTEEVIDVDVDGEVDEDEDDSVIYAVDEYDGDDDEFYIEIEDKVADAIDEQQNEIVNIDVKMLRELHLVERKFFDLKEKFFVKRNEIIRKGVEGFWGRVLMQHEDIRFQFEDVDVEILGYLVDIKVENFEGDGEIDEEEEEEKGQKKGKGKAKAKAKAVPIPKGKGKGRKSSSSSSPSCYGYHVHFYFSPNPFFPHSVITKTILFYEADDTFAVFSQPSPLKWKVKNFTQKYPNSFFVLWTDNFEDLDKENPELVRDYNLMDYNIAETIRKEIYNDPLQHHEAVESQDEDEEIPSDMADSGDE